MKTVHDFALNLQTKIARWAPIPLRLIVGYGFMEHGYAKLSKGSDAFAGILQSMGVPSPHFTAWATILIELLGASQSLWAPSWRLSPYQWRPSYW
jgi:uncharacterized membrane protein YphA (DoxX/SURF4 family)